MNVARKLGPSSENTRSAVLDLIRSSGIVSRIELAEMSGLTAASITRVVKALIAEGLVIETGFGDSTGGKRPSLIQLNPLARHAVGVSLDDARLTYVVTDAGGNLIGQAVSRGINGELPGEVTPRIADELARLLTQLDISPSSVVGVGVAGAGLDLGAGSQPLSLTASEWDSFAVEEVLASLTGFPVLWDNDAACAALGQFWATRMPATQDFATLYLANGFGMGLMTSGGLSRGASSNVGEVGHMVLEAQGPECWCGARGCLEVLAAPKAIVAQVMQYPDLVQELGLSGAERPSRHDFDSIANAAARGEPRCVAAIERSAGYVALAMLSVVNLLDLDRIYLAGPGFLYAGGIYVKHIRELLATSARSRAVHSVIVELSDPTFDAAAMGAASVALQHVLTPHARAFRATAGSG
jgi:predicted NBD/HSP70 family sugar kinase